MEKQEGLKLDLQNTQMITDEDGAILFMPAYILRKVSKFITGGQNDEVAPIQVWFNPQTGKILREGLPAWLTEEIDEHNKN